jgi:acyl-[acyl-carrier-protein]-phospholipid O-acyltransferase/long-chain-fatty-acid--[acyl-carrier-protein] ligase
MPPLMLSRRFAPLFWCQFFAAFNDNFLKTALVFLILFQVASQDSEALITAASAVFIAPFFFLSGLAGELADRFDKARMAQAVKFAEIFIAGLSVYGYELQSIPIMFVALAGFGINAALFGPVKYGILPDHLPRERLPTANALIEGATFIAILTGTIAAGLAARDGRDTVLFGALVMAFSLACWLSALVIPPSGQGAPHLKVRANIAASTIAMFRYLRSDRRLWWGALVTSWFWVVGIVVLSLLPPLIKNLIGGNEDAVTACLALFSIAVGIGSGIAAKIARGRIVLKTTLVGAILLALFALDLGFAGYGSAAATVLREPNVALTSGLGLRAAIDLFGMAVAGGLFIVPVFAAVQAWSDVAYRARTIAAVNVLNAAFMTAATLLVAVLQKFGVTLPVLFLLLGTASSLVALAIWKTMPIPEPSSSAKADDPVNTDFSAQ